MRLEPISQSSRRSASQPAGWPASRPSGEGAFGHPSAIAYSGSSPPDAFWRAWRSRMSTPRPGHGVESNGGRNGTKELWGKGAEESPPPGGEGHRPKTEARENRILGVRMEVWRRKLRVLGKGGCWGSGNFVCGRWGPKKVGVSWLTPENGYAESMLLDGRNGERNWKTTAGGLRNGEVNM